ncbi:MAG TPA: CHAT domain-containing protein, partial [Sphingopyxis sp.]|nr:CHAT domain-containing protein [Sphingopyxis sp.]
MTARRPYALTTLGALVLGLPAVASAQEVQDPTLRDRFAIGDKGGSLCEVQATVRDPVISGMFDRAWTILCRDASQPVGYVRMLRATPADAAARIERARGASIVCTGPERCTVKDSDVAWTTRIESAGNTAYTVEGFSAYDDALTLALESIRRRKVASGVIDVATTSVGGNDGFARTLAGAIDVDR